MVKFLVKFGYQSYDGLWLNFWLYVLGSLWWVLLGFVCFLEGGTFVSCICYFQYLWYCSVY